MKIETDFDIGDSVKIIGDWIAKIVAIQIDADHSVSYKLLWIGNEAIQFDTISQSEMRILEIKKMVKTEDTTKSIPHMKTDHRIKSIENWGLD